MHSPSAVRKVGNRLDRCLDLSVRLRCRAHVFSLVRAANACVWLGVAVVVPIQVMSNPDASAGPYVANKKKPIGGNIMTHASTRLQFKGARSNTQMAKIYDSPCLPESETQFASISTVLKIQTKNFRYLPLSSSCFPFSMYRYSTTSAFTLSFSSGIRVWQPLLY